MFCVLTLGLEKERERDSGRGSGRHHPGMQSFGALGGCGSRMLEFCYLAGGKRGAKERKTQRERQRRLYFCVGEGAEGLVFRAAVVLVIG